MFCLSSSRKNLNRCHEKTFEITQGSLFLNTTTLGLFWSKRILSLAQDIVKRKERHVAFPLSPKMELQWTRHFCCLF